MQVNINYGKFIEDPRKRIHIKYLKSFEDLDATLKFHVDGSPKVINEQLVQVIIITIIIIAPQSFSGGGLVFKVKLVTMERV